MILSNDDCGGVCTNYIKKYKKFVYKVSDNRGRFTSCYELLSAQVDYAAGSTLLIKRKVINQIGLFDTSFRRHQDWEFLIRFFRFYALEILPSIDVVICADGVRNTPCTELLLNVKMKLLCAFQSDIKALEKQQQRLVYQSQWKEIILNYLKEKKYRICFSFARQKVDLSLWGMTDLMNSLLAFSVGIIPNIIVAVYWIYNLKYSSIYKKLI